MFMKALHLKSINFYKIKPQCQDRLQFSMSSIWRTLWFEALDIVTRQIKHASIANDQTILNHVTKVVGFLHTCRDYIAYDGIKEALIIA